MKILIILKKMSFFVYKPTICKKYFYMTINL